MPESWYLIVWKEPCNATFSIFWGYSVEMKSSCVAHGFAYKKPLFVEG